MKYLKLILVSLVAGTVLFGGGVVNAAGYVVEETYVPMEFNAPVQTDAVKPTEGSVVRQRGSARAYLIYKGKKLKIADRFTYSQVLVPGTRPILATKEVLAQFPDGEVLKISPPKVQGIYDMHEHYRVGGYLPIYRAVAKTLGVEHTVFVPTGNSPDNKGYLKHMDALLKQQAKDPDHVIAFCTIDEADPEAPQIYRNCLERGGMGVKILGGHPDLYDTPLDNDIMREVFQISNERDVPVLIHVSIITLPTAKKEFENLMNLYPNTRVQFAHYCSTIMEGIHLDQCVAFLDAYPNMIIDLSMGGGIERYFKFMTQEFPSPKDPNEKVLGIDIIRDFLLKYQDRIVYGTDMIVAAKGPTSDPVWVKNRMMCDFSLLQEKWYRCPQVNNKGQYTLLPGFNFSDEILQKIFVENPKKFLKVGE